MPETAIRFGLKNNENKRSSIWKCWTNSGKGKNDVYVTNRAVGKAMKVSLHESGSWHIAFDSHFLNREIEGESRLRSNRFVDKWQRPHEISKGCRLALRIVISEDVVTTPITDRDPLSTSWISSPPPGKAIEIVLLFTTPCADVSNWPGRDSMKTQLLGTFQIESGYRAWLVYYMVDKPTMDQRKGTMTLFKSGKATVRQKGIYRAIIPSQAPDGSRVIYECNAEIS